MCIRDRCYYDQTPAGTIAEVAAYGDVGPLLAAAMRANERIAHLKVRQPPETIRATVLGAAGQTVTLSGSTIWADADLLPLRNLPVVRPATVGAGQFAEAVGVALARWDLERDALVAIVVDLPSGVAYACLLYTSRCV